jgi:hypothetical protein
VTIVHVPSPGLIDIPVTPVPVELEALLPQPDDVAFYEEHGYWVSGKVLPDALIDAAMAGAERHWRGERDWPLPAQGRFSDWDPMQGETLRNSEYVSLQNREIHALVHEPVIGMIAARLSRSAVVRLWDDQLVSGHHRGAARGHGRCLSTAIAPQAPPR